MQVSKLIHGALVFFLDTDMAHILWNLCSWRTRICNRTMGGGYKADFLCSVIFLIFQHRQNTCYLLNTTFIFDRCCRSSAAVTPVKYEWDSKNITDTFARSKILLTKKLTNGVLVAITPWLLMPWWWSTKPRHQKPCYWPSLPKIFCSKHQRDRCPQWPNFNTSQSISEQSRVPTLDSPLWDIHVDFAPKQVCKTWITNYITQYSLWCNYLFMPQIPTYSANILKWSSTWERHLFPYPIPPPIPPPSYLWTNQLGQCLKKSCLKGLIPCL